jgi:hypothetical protein
MMSKLIPPLSSYVDSPCLNGLIERYGENFQRMERYEKFIIIATITTYFAEYHTGFSLNFSDAYWENNVLFHIADMVPVWCRIHFDELGQLDEEKLLKLCEFLVTDLIATKEVIKS